MSNTTHAAILTVEKRKYRPASWTLHGTYSVRVMLTAKRAQIADGVYKGKLFNRATGAEILRQDERIWQSYRHSLYIHK